MRWRNDCTCARTMFGHEPGCAIYDDDNDADHYDEQAFDMDREEAEL